MSAQQIDRPRSTQTTLDWDALRVFLSVARTNSITAAANQLDVSQPTISRKIRSLEEQFSARLFDRTVTGVTLTQAGSKVFERASRMEQEAFALSDASLDQDKELSGDITLTAPEGIGLKILPSIISEFSDSYNEINITLLLGSSQTNLLNREADIAIRIGDPGQSTLVGTRIKEISFGLFASPAYLAQFGEPIYRTSLNKHRLIDGAGDLANTPQSCELAALAPDARRALRSNSINSQLLAAHAGVGIAALPKYVVSGADDLQEVLPGALTARSEAWVLYHRDLKDVARIRAFAGFAAKHLRDCL